MLKQFRRIHSIASLAMWINRSGICRKEMTEKMQGRSNHWQIIAGFPAPAV
jgi:hypothetical protein